MSEHHPAERGPAPEKPDYGQFSDLKLTHVMRAGGPHAYMAAGLLRRRHLASGLSYALLCANGQVAAQQLADRAFAKACEAVREGTAPNRPWRWRLLLDVQREAADWAFGALRSELAPGFAAFVDGLETRSAGPFRIEVALRERSAVRAAFEQLAEVRQGLLLCSMIEDEPQEQVGVAFGIDPSDVPDETAKARQALRDAILRTHFDSGSRPDCRGFARILDIVARPGETRRSEDFEQHLADCPYCSRTLDLIRGLEKYPRTALAEGLLVWGGAAYVAARLAPDAAGEEPAQPEAGEQTVLLPTLAVPTGPPSAPVVSHAAARARRSPLWTVLFAVAAAACATVAVYFFATATSSPARNPHHMEAAAMPSSAPTSPSPSLAAPTSAAPTSPSPAPTFPPTSTPTPSIAPTHARQKPSPTSVVYTGGYRELVNAGSGLCLDVDGGYPSDGADAVTATCNGGASQQWLFNDRGLVQNRADPSYCLDSRGATDRGVGLWSCTAVDGGNGQNLEFLIDSNSRIRPLIAPDFALNANSGSGGKAVCLQPVAQTNAQRWLTGSMVYAS